MFYKIYHISRAQVRQNKCKCTRNAIFIKKNVFARDNNFSLPEKNFVFLLKEKARLFLQNSIARIILSLTTDRRHYTASHKSNHTTEEG